VDRSLGRRCDKRCRRQRRRRRGRRSHRLQHPKQRRQRCCGSRRWQWPHMPVLGPQLPGQEQVQPPLLHLVLQQRRNLLEARHATCGGLPEAAGRWLIAHNRAASCLPAASPHVCTNLVGAGRRRGAARGAAARAEGARWAGAGGALQPRRHLLPVRRPGAPAQPAAA
jgi:hypothetical protein